jgi:putrescine transport system ATP-binding protein
VVVTHDQEEAMTLASRIAVMDQGVIRQIGSPTDIYEHPNSRFVADFIGSINMVDGEVARSEGKRRGGTCAALGAARLRGGRQTSCGKGDKVSVAFRPEKVTISRRKPAAAITC